MAVESTAIIDCNKIIQCKALLSYRLLNKDEAKEAIQFYNLMIQQLAEVIIVP